MMSNSATPEQEKQFWRDRLKTARADREGAERQCRYFTQKIREIEREEYERNPDTRDKP